MSIDSKNEYSSRSNENNDNYVISFDEIKERYKGVSLAEANSRFFKEFFDAPMQSVFQNYSKDSSLRFTIADDDEISTAAIDPKSGKIMIGKSLALACLDGDSACNKELLIFIIGHEIGHYLDLYSPADKPIGFSQTLKSFIDYLENLKTKINDKWGKPDIDKNENKENEDNEKINPIYFLYHQLFNKLDDTHVNERAIKGFASLQSKSFDLPKIYETSLFKQVEYFRYQTLLTEQFGNYLLQKTMNPGLELGVDPLVQAELDKKYSYNGKEMTLEEILCYSKNAFNWYSAAKRYPGIYDKFFIPAFERLLEEDKKDRDRLDRFTKELMKNAKSNKKNSNPGESRKGVPDPFGDMIQEAREMAEQAKEADKQKINKNRKDNEDKSESDEAKAKDNLKDFARNVALDNHLDVDKTTKYFEYKNELINDIEDLADFLIAILLRNKTETVTILERRKKSW